MNDNIDDPDEGLPPTGTQDDIEGALKWLEGLTAREGKQSDQPSISDASLESPFHGLIDSEEGDMPDWLREVPSALSSTQGEMESRLDWLAKMAQRESIEELPTLEWRRLTEPVQNSILSARGEPNQTEDSVPAEEDMSPQEQDAEEAALSPDITPIYAPELPDYEDLPVEDLDAAMAWIEELAASQDAPVEDIPSVADRALASKLMMEAGLTPDSSPMNEMISDSALLDSIVPTHPFLEEEDSADTIVLGETTGPDQADHIPPIVESKTGEEVVAGESSDEPVPDEAPPFTETSTDLPDDFKAGSVDDVTGGAGAIDEAGEALSFEEAMAYLDEISTTSSAESPEIDSEPSEHETEMEASTVEQETKETGEIALVEAVAETAAEEETGEVEELLAEEAPWLEHEASLEAEPAIDKESIVETEELAINEIPFETPVGMVESEMADSTDEVLETLEDEDLNAEEAPWYEESQLFPEIETEQNGDDLNVSVADQQELSPSPIMAFVPEALPEDEPEESLEEIDSEFALDEDDLLEDASEAATLEEPLPEYGWPLVDTADPGGTIDGTQLEEALLTLDSMALPSGKTLADIDAAWREFPIAPTRDVTTALAWLESILAPAEPEQPAHAHIPELEEAELIDRMPDDPDAILAWLEQMSDEDSISPAPPVFSDEKPLAHDDSGDTYEPLSDDFFEADLLAMPEDPDEAMIWLESLARGGEPPPMPSKVELIISETQDIPEDIPSSEPVTEELGRESDQAEGKDQFDKPSTDDESESPDTIGDQSSDGWVDLLKPID